MPVIFSKGFLMCFGSPFLWDTNQSVLSPVFCSAHRTCDCNVSCFVSIASARFICGHSFIFLQSGSNIFTFWSTKYIHIFQFLYIFQYIFMYIYICVCVCVCSLYICFGIYIYMYCLLSLICYYLFCPLYFSRVPIVPCPDMWLFLYWPTFHQIIWWHVLNYVWFWFFSRHHFYNLTIDFHHHTMVWMLVLRTRIIVLRLAESWPAASHP